MATWKDPIHPGEILADELAEISMTAADLAKRIGVPNNRVYQIVNGKRDITADTALRLGQFFGTGPELWMNLQKAYELDIARQNGRQAQAHQALSAHAIEPASKFVRKNKPVTHSLPVSRPGEILKEHFSSVW